MFSTATTEPFENDLHIIKCEIKLFLSFQISNSICDIFKFDCLVFINTKYDKETKQI